MLPDKPILIGSAEALLNLANGTNPFTTINSRYKYSAAYYDSDTNTIHLVFSDAPKEDDYFTYFATTGQLASILNSYNVCCLVPNLRIGVVAKDGLFTDLNLYYAGYYQTTNPGAYLLTLVTSKELVDDEFYLANR